MMNSSSTPIQDKQTGLHPDQDKPIGIALPDIPTPELSFDLATFIPPSGGDTEEEQKVQKRASNVLKLAEENEKLKAELKAMTDRLEAAERRRAELLNKEQKLFEEPSS